jgi:hypothetical protein
VPRLLRFTRERYGIEVRPRKGGSTRDTKYDAVATPQMYPALVPVEPRPFGVFEVLAAAHVNDARPSRVVVPLNLIACLAAAGRRKHRPPKKPTPKPETNNKSQQRPDHRQYEGSRS